MSRHEPARHEAPDTQPEEGKADLQDLLPFQQSLDIRLIFCGWIWGITGALLAVPLLAIIKIISDQVEQLAPIGEFLGTESKVATA